MYELSNPATLCWALSLFIMHKNMISLPVRVQKTTSIFVFVNRFVDFLGRIPQRLEPTRFGTVYMYLDIVVAGTGTAVVLVG